VDREKNVWGWGMMENLELRDEEDTRTLKEIKGKRRKQSKASVSPRQEHKRIPSMLGGVTPYRKGGKTYRIRY